MANYTHSAYWVRFSLADVASRERVRWLTVGDPRLNDIQVFIQSAGHWRRMHAGSTYPAEEWAVLARLPSCPLYAEGDSSVLIGATSRSR